MARLMPTALLDVFENDILGHVLVSGNAGENPIQGPYSEGHARWDCDAVGFWMLGLKDDVTAYLMDDLVFPALAEVLDQRFSAQIAW
jgi:hypothetical protein